jgi:dTMP kinase
MAGLFISLDGIDGSGKSTQAKALGDWFARAGREVILLRDPGGTRLGESLREILLHRNEISLSMTAEMLLYMASRAQLVTEVIRPSLAKGCIVISDRFLLANVVYQGYAGGESVETVWSVGNIATGGLNPDLTFVFDMPVADALRRIERGFDRLESRGESYMEKVRQGFIAESKRLGALAIHVDASQSIEAIHQRIINEIQKRGLA